jgi:hypothetical protein
VRAGDSSRPHMTTVDSPVERWTSRPSRRYSRKSRKSASRWSWYIKFDRLTRSLTDFSKIVEIFDANGVSFVAVTRQFNTTSSMGRLTLNVLLSFAQFEREVTGERIRYKIAASKRKGMWMGGTVPLGYDVRDRRLVVNARSRTEKDSLADDAV